MVLLFPKSLTTDTCHDLLSVSATLLGVTRCTRLRTTVPFSEGFILYLGKQERPMGSSIMESTMTQELTINMEK